MSYRSNECSRIASSDSLLKQKTTLKINGQLNKWQIILVLQSRYHELVNPFCRMLEMGEVEESNDQDSLSSLFSLLLL